MTLPDGPADGPAPGEPAPPPALGGRLLSPRSVVSLALAAGLIGLFLRGQDPAALREAGRAIRGADPLLYLGALGTYYLAFPIRGLRWRLLLGNAGVPAAQIPPAPRLARIIYLSWFVNSIVPAKLGDLYRGWLLRREGGPSWSAGMGTIVAERLLDFFVLVSLTITTGLLTYGDVLTRDLPGGVGACLRGGVSLEHLGCVLVQLFTAAGAAVIALALGLVAFARWGRGLAGRLPARAVGLYDRFGQALILSFRRFPLVLGLSALAWMAEGGAFLLVGRALGHVLPLPLVVFFSLLQALITVIPLTPGGLGMEPILAAALTLRGYPGGAALAMTGLYRTISFLSLVVGGAVVYVLTARRPPYAERRAA